MIPSPLNHLLPVKCLCHFLCANLGLSSSSLSSSSPPLTKGTWKRSQGNKSVRSGFITWILNGNSALYARENDLIATLSIVTASLPRPDCLEDFLHVTFYPLHRLGSIDEWVPKEYYQDSEMEDSSVATLVVTYKVHKKEQNLYTNMSLTLDTLGCL